MKFFRSKLPWALFLGCIVGFAAYGGNVSATPPSGVTNQVLARGNDKSPGTLPLQEGTDIVVAQVSIGVGGSSGWHTHPGGAIVVIQQGSATLYRSTGQGCQTFTYSAGQAFIERPSETVDVVNTGLIPFVVYVTYPRVPVGASTRIDLPNPGTCPV